jgi:hypothetical protein
MGKCSLVSRITIEYEVIDGQVSASVVGCHSDRLPIPKSEYVRFEAEYELQALAGLALFGLARKLVGHAFPDKVRKALEDADAALYQWKNGER